MIWAAAISCLLLQVGDIRPSHTEGTTSRRPPTTSVAGVLGTLSFSLVDIWCYACSEILIVDLYDHIGHLCVEVKCVCTDLIPDHPDIIRP